MKKTAAIIIVAAVHFGLCSLVNTAALAGTAANVLKTGLPASTAFLLGLSRVLYFPILSLHLVSRNWFPGDLIMIVMAANSLLWGLAVVWGTSAVRKQLKNRAASPAPRKEQHSDDKRKRH